MGNELNEIISSAEAALRRALYLLRPEQRQHLLSQAETAFAQLSAHVEEMRVQGEKDEVLINRLAGRLGQYWGKTADEVLEEYR